MKRSLLPGRTTITMVVLAAFFVRCVTPAYADKSAVKLQNWEGSIDLTTSRSARRSVMLVNRLSRTFRSFDRSMNQLRWSFSASASVRTACRCASNPASRGDPFAPSPRESVTSTTMPRPSHSPTIHRSRFHLLGPHSPMLRYFLA